MAETDYTGLVPENYDGKQISAGSTVDLPDTAAAAELYRTARTRLLNANAWNDLAPGLMATFQVTDASGGEHPGEVSSGCYLRIDIPGPGSPSGGGFDWVKVEEVEEHSLPDGESTGFRVRPSPAPQSGNRDTAHFYNPAGTSTFTVARTGTSVTSAVFDRNIRINNESGDLTDRIRNTLIGTVGRMLFSKVQWKALCDALVDQPKS